MVARVFLGWDRPILGPVVDWLLAHEDSLPGMVVLTPTAQSARRLREALAAEAGAVLAPRMHTPGSLLTPEDADVAPDWAEQTAWLETLENIRDWSEYDALFPNPPEESTDWAGGLAAELTGLRRYLQENGLMIADAARRLAESIEADRWAALARLEEQVERRLSSWGWRSRSRILKAGVSLPPRATMFVLAGVPDLPPLVARALSSSTVPVFCLIAAPEEEAGSFSELGQAADDWNGRPLAWPAENEGSVSVAADPRQQATEALRLVASGGRGSDEIALGATDSETGDELARAFTRSGWIAFQPAAQATGGGLVRWLRAWSQWIARPDLATVADLLALPETGGLIDWKRAQKARTLADLRNRWMLQTPDDLRRRTASATEIPEETAELLAAVTELENRRASLSGGNFRAEMQSIIGSLARTGPTQADQRAAVEDWLIAAAPLIDRLDRAPRYWLDLLASQLPSPTPVPPDGRVIDVQGWLELFHEPGQHLVICGLNETKVPARGGGEPWLGEAARELLGLTRDTARSARDAYLFHAMLTARADGGRVDLLCGKTGAGGEALLPSRLLLAAAPDDLPDRVRLLFKEVEPPEAGLRWHADWLWQPRHVTPRPRISATALRDYLACPFRFYLKHVVGMQATESDRNEWNPRDFGNIAHTVLENWGNDPAARASTNPEEIEAWLSAELDRIVASSFGRTPPLAVRIQTEALRQRLVWFSEIQAGETAAGWEIQEVERKIELDFNGTTIAAKIDRIDRHLHDGRLRVIDYKTGKVDSVAREHRSKVTSTTRLPAHLEGDCPAIHEAMDKDRSASFRWTNLQLPLYAEALVRDGEALPEPGYITLGETKADVKLQAWEDFGESDLESARDCAAWIADRVAAGVFWPPAEKTTYDDYRTILAPGGDLAASISPDFQNRAGQP